MGFVDFLIDLAKGILGLVIAVILVFAGSFALLESTIMGIILMLGGFIALAFFVYNKKQMRRKY